jgi:hypothetical protein
MFRAVTAWIWTLCMIFALAAASRLSAQEKGGGQESAVGGAQPEPHAEEGRLKINLPTVEMTAAQDNKIPLDLHGYAVKSIMADWKFSQPGVEGAVIAEPEELSLQHAPDGGAYVNFVPIRLGKLQLRIAVDFEDGGYDQESVEVNVDRLPDRAPERFILTFPLERANHIRKAGTLHLDLSPQFDRVSVTPAAFYKGFASPIYLTPTPSPLRSDIAVAVIPRKNQASPIAFDPWTGEVKAVRLGQALIKVTLRGKSAYSCVDVMRDRREFNERSDCKDFLPAGLTEPIDEPLQMPKAAQPRPH